MENKKRKPNLDGKFSLADSIVFHVPRLLTKVFKLILPLFKEFVTAVRRLAKVFKIEKHDAL